MKDIFYIIFYTQTSLSGFVAIVCFFLLAKREKTTNLIGLLFLVGFLCNVSAYLLSTSGLGKIVNLPSSLFDLCLITIAGILYNHITHHRYVGLLRVTTILYLVFAVSNLIFFQKVDVSSYSKLLGSFLIIIYAVVYFYRLMVEMPTTHIHKLPMFWINSGFLVYHAGTIFLFAFTSYLTAVLKNNLQDYWIFHNCLNIVEHFLVLVGLYYQGILNTTDREP